MYLPTIMGEKGSAWILCPSKRFPGQFYYFNTQNGEKAWSWTDPSNKPHLECNEGSPLAKRNNSFIGNTQAEYKLANNPVTPRQPKQLHTEISSPMSDNTFGNAQAVYKLMPNNPVLSGQPKELQMQYRELSLAMSDKNFIDNTQTGNKLTPNNPVLWRPNELDMESGEFGTPKTNTSNYSETTQTRYKVVTNNSYLSRLPKRLHTELREFGSSTTDSSNCPGITKLRHKMVQSNPISFRRSTSREFSSPTATNNIKNQVRYKPILWNPFSSGQSKQLRTHNNELGQVMKKVKIDKQSSTLSCNIDITELVSDNKSSPTTQKVDVGIDIKFLRNLSKFKSVEEWHIVPDADVLLENLDFLKEFIAGDSSCMLMTPVAVLKKLQSVSDSRATDVEQVYKLLTNHYVCETNDQDKYSLNEADIQEQIIKCCVEATKILHVVIVTTKECLRDAARINDVHAYHLSELKITNETGEVDNPKENFFLQSTDRFDPFLVSKSVKSLNVLSSPNEFTNYINEKNNVTINNLNCPTIKPSRLQNVYGNTKSRTSDNIEIHVKKNGDRTIFCNQNRQTNDQKNVIKSSGRYLQNIHISVNRNKETCTITPNPNAQKQKRFEGFSFNTATDTDVCNTHTHNSFVINKSQNVVEPNSQKQINLFKGFRFNTPVNTNIFHSNVSETNENQNVIIPYTQKPTNQFKDFRCNSIDTSVFHSNGSETNEKQSIVKPNAQKRINGGFSFNTALDTNEFYDHASELNDNLNDLKPYTQKQIDPLEDCRFDVTINKNVFHSKSSEANENQTIVKPYMQNQNNQFQSFMSNTAIATNVFNNNSLEINDNRNIVKANAQKQIAQVGDINVPIETYENENESVNAQKEANSVNLNLCNGEVISDTIYEDYETIEEKLEDFWLKHLNLQGNINDRVEEWSCCFVQIMEQFIDEVIIVSYQNGPVKKFYTPYWFLQGLKCLRDHYSQNKHVCTIIDKLIGMCGFCIKNGIVRTNIKSEQFLKILGAGILLIEAIDKILPPDVNISDYYKEMLSNMIATIREPEDFPDVMSLSLELSNKIGDAAFRMENAESENETQAVCCGRKLPSDPASQLSLQSQ